MFDVITIGDSLIDTFVPLVDAQIVEKDNSKLLSLEYGKKIPVEPLVSLVGGNACNSAVGSSRLGLKTAIYTNIGNKDEEEADQRIKLKLKKENVDLRYLKEDPNLPSGHNIVLTFKGERTILTHHQSWKYDLPQLDKASFIYLTSLSPSYIESSIIDQVINYIERYNCKLLFQPGTFQIKQGLKKNSKLLFLSEVFILNLEEAKIFLGKKDSENISIKKLLKELIDFGPKNIIITNGREGSFGFNGQNYYKLAAFPAKLLEATGAGDAYAAGVLTGLFYGNDLSEAMRWGAANSASVVEQIGAQTGLLTYDQMQEKLKENQRIVAKNDVIS